jgi:hypothetical protein
MTITEHINGRQRGRVPPDLPVHTFKDSGITVRLHKLSPITTQQILAQCQRELADTKPEPPLFEQDYGTGKKIMEPHIGHPLYQEKLAAWNTEANKLANDRLFKLAALDAIEVTIGESERAAIARKKRMLKIAAHITWDDDPDLTPEENDQLFYVSHICCATPTDLQEFYEAIALRSQPTEAAVEQHKAAFPGDLQGSISVGL